MMRPRTRLFDGFAQKLTAWYGAHARSLPWRKTSDPYQIWISEVMLQQTTVTAVIPFYARWMKIFPNIQSVARAPLQKVLKVWQGLGYYSRAKNIHRSAKIIFEKYRGRIPAEYETLRKLPGFGPYTTGAVLSIAFDGRHPIIDANVRRVCMRLLGIEGYADPSQDKVIRDFLCRVLPPRKVGLFNQGLMELGALVCRSKEVLCNICPVRPFCQAYKTGRQELIPRIKKSHLREVYAVVAIIKKNRRYLIQRRPPKGLFADLWEFPGGKMEKGETPQKALQRELKEELDVEIKKARPAFHVRQFYTQFRANLSVWNCSLKSYPKSSLNRRWVSAGEFRHFPMPSGSAQIVDRLLNPNFALGIFNAKFDNMKKLPPASILKYRQG